MDKDKLVEKYNWDNKFSTRFKLTNGQMLKYIPDNIFMVELPDLKVENYADMGNEDNVVSDKMLILTLRSTKDGYVEKELSDILMHTSFDFELSLSNPNKCHSIYKGCSVEKVKFSPLLNRPNKANPFNLIVYITVEQINYYASDDVLSFGTLSNQSIGNDNEGVNNG